MAQIITIGKRRWLAGMHWTSYEETPGKEELRQDAQRTQGMGQGRNSIAPAWIALRTNDEAIQAGFAEAIGVKSPKHIASLAAMLADSKVQPWNGIFQIADDLWWYIAVRDGHAILPDGDVIGTKAEIDAARQRHASFTDWNVVEGDLGLLEAMLNAVVHKPTPVRSTVSNHLPMMWMVVGSVVLVGLAIGGWQWQVHTAETERLRAQLLEKIRSQETTQPAPTLEKMLAATPRPSYWLSGCQQAIYPLSLSYQGWQLDQVECHHTSAIAHWRRGDGATVANRPEGTLRPDDNAVDQSIALAFSAEVHSEQLVALPLARKTLRAWTQARALSLKMGQPAQLAAMPGAQPAKPADVVLPNNLTVTLNMTSPFTFGAEFDAIPGLRLTSIKSLSDGRWDMQGVLYGR